MITQSQSLMQTDLSLITTGILIFDTVFDAIL